MTKRMMIRFLPLLLLVVALFPAAAAQEGHLTLLTVSQSDDAMMAEGRGGTADLYLRIEPGRGNIYIDSFPLTRLDTQSSTRYANRVACSLIEAECDRYDFFYTIRAGSTVVGGPSAGAAIAVLTAALLAGVEVDESVAMTGTINSGGLVGPVAGIPEKVAAAEGAGLSKVLISGFSYPSRVNRSYLALLNGTNGSLPNRSINFSRLYLPINLSNFTIPIVEVTSLEQALEEFTGQSVVERSSGEIEVDPSYARIMESVSAHLCDRRRELRLRLNLSAHFTGENASLRREEAAEAGDWYSLASYCFGELLTIRTEEAANLSSLERQVLMTATLRDVAAFEAEVEERELSTMADLETAIIVTERLREAKDALLEENRSNVSASALAYAIERLNSAQAWSALFHMESPEISLNQEHLSRACTERLREAEERAEYAELYLPASYLAPAREELQRARGDSAEAEYALCLFRASKGLALSNLLVSSLSVPEEKLGVLVEQKLEAVAQVIAEQERKGHFPVIGYSYYRYASSLASHDPYSALTFAEYALELSNLDLYFPREPSFRFPARQATLLLLVVSSVSFGLLLGLLLGFRLGRRKGRILKGVSRSSKRRNK